MQSDEAIAARVAQQDEEAFHQLMTRHLTRFYHVAYAVVLNKEDAEDIVQEAFLKLWHGKAVWSSDHKAKFTTWFYRIVYNQAIDHTRKKPMFHVMDKDYADQSAGNNAEYVVEAQEQRQAMDIAMQQLPERQRTALSLVYQQELKQQEVAEIMGNNIKAVESLLSRGKA